MTGDRLKALDGLRALSVAGVFASGFHWLLPFGWAGVLVFYVLSGFLITRILLDERSHARDENADNEPNGRGALSYFKRFYFRRSLRIFPLYFAYLFVLEVTHLLFAEPAGWASTRPYAYLYVINFGMMTERVPMLDVFAHLWTLSVEEQFYLAWPIVVWLAPRAKLLRIAIALVALGPVVRFASMQLAGFSVDDVYLSSFSHVDAFAVGAVLASHDFSSVKHPRRLAALALGVALVLGAVVVVRTGIAVRSLGYFEGLPHCGGYLWGYTVLNVTAGCTILAALRGELPLLEAPWLAYLGRISYGIYLVQRPILGLYLEHLEPAVLASLPPGTLGVALGITLGAAACMATTIAIAALSYRFFEQPLLRYRDRAMPALRSIRTMS